MTQDRSAIAGRHRFTGRNVAGFTGAGHSSGNRIGATEFCLAHGATAALSYGYVVCRREPREALSARRNPLDHQLVGHSENRCGGPRAWVTLQSDGCGKHRTLPHRPFRSRDFRRCRSWNSSLSLTMAGDDGTWAGVRARHRADMA